MNKNDFSYPQTPPTLAIRKTTNRLLVSNSIYLIITTVLISAIDSWSHPLSWFVFAAMVLKFVGSIETNYALILSGSYKEGSHGALG
jgi:hypothetical protein